MSNNDIFPLFSPIFHVDSLNFLVIIGILCYYFSIIDKRRFFMEYITTKEASTKWGISPTRITILAKEGRIPGAQKFGKNWLIPASATKPPELNANHSRSKKKETSVFSFPLYHFRPDYNYIKENIPTEQQQRLLSAESAVLECRYNDAYPILNSILQSPEDISTEIGGLWNILICCIVLNKPKDFSRFYLRLQMIFSNDFQYKDNYLIILDSLNTYLETMSSVAKNGYSYTDIQEQCIPMLCLLMGYSILSKEAINPSTTDIKLLELNLCLLKNTSAVIVIEMMHFYLLGIYYFRQDMIDAEKHAKLAIQLAFENKYYYPLITYYRYFSQILSPILEQYPEDFKNHCHELTSQYEKNYIAFAATLDKYSITSKITDTDYPYIYSVLTDLPNTTIAKKLGISQRTVKRRLDMICEKLGVNNRKDLKLYLQNCM